MYDDQIQATRGELAELRTRVADLEAQAERDAELLTQLTGLLGAMQKTQVAALRAIERLQGEAIRGDPCGSRLDLDGPRFAPGDRPDIGG